MKMKIPKPNSGFTIIETMIAISLFTIIILAGMGALLNANAMHRKSQDMRSVMDSLSFVMEDMSRNLRVGYNYHCLTTTPPVLSSGAATPLSCSTGGGILFESSTGDPDDDADQWMYYISGERLYKSTTGAYAGFQAVQLTPDEVAVDLSSGFSVLGAEPTDTQQPFVIIRLSGRITNPRNNVVSPFVLETAVSQRLIDIQ